MFHLQGIKDVIISFEREQDLSSWKYHGMDIWPVLRSLVFIECRNELNSIHNNVQLDWLRKSKRRRISSFLKKLKNKLDFRNKNLNRAEKNVAKSIKGEIVPIHAVFFGSWYFRTTYEGRFINKYFYPLIKLLEKKFNLKSVEVEYATGYKFRSEYAQISNQIDFIDSYEPADYDGNRIESLKQDYRFVSFFDLLVKAGVRKELRDGMLQKIEKIYLDSFRYEQIFSNYRPKLAFCLTFFNEQMFAMLFAASKAGIKSVDVGHGFPADPENMIYNKFVNFPKGGYNTMPDFFWVWDDPVKEAMGQWIQSQGRHQVLVGGNPWLSYILPNIPIKKLSSKTVVLYTLTVNHPEPFIMEAMKKSEEQLEWWIRLHPAISQSKEEVKEKFLAKGLRNFNLDEANRLELPFLLKNTDVHISRNSSSVFESISIGNIPILLDEESQSAYSMSIKSKLVIQLPSQTAESLLATIDYAIKKPKYSSQNLNKSQDALNFLLQATFSELSFNES